MPGSKLSILTILFVCLVACSTDVQKPDGNAPSQDSNRSNTATAADAANAAPINNGEQKPAVRRESDCEDIELVAPLASIDRAALAQKIDALTPKGKTPITNALRRAFDVVRAQAVERTVSF